MPLRYVNKAGHRVDKAARSSRRSPCPPRDSAARRLGQPSAGIVGSSQPPSMLAHRYMEFVVAGRPQPVRFRCGEPGKHAADSQCSNLFCRQLRKAVVALPCAEYFAAAHCSRQRVRRMTVTQQFMGGRDSAAPPDVVVDGVHASRLRLRLYGEDGSLSIGAQHPISFRYDGEVESMPRGLRAITRVRWR